MAFKITSETEEDLQIFQLSDLSGGVQAQILPVAGAMLHAFSVPYDNRRIQIINSYKNLTDFQKYHPSTYKSAKLSPFVCRILDGKYTFENKPYEFLKKFPDGNAIHGVISDKPFKVINKSEQDDQASLTLEYDYKQDDPGFPFNYLIQVKYTLKTLGRLSLVTTVKNTSSVAFPLSDGWHPYFSLGGSVNNWTLSFHSKKIVVFNERLIPTGELIDTDRFNTPKIIGEEFFDHCFYLDPPGDSASAVLENPKTGLRLSFFPDEKYRYLQIYTPPDRKSIAIENLSAAPDSFNNGMGLTILSPGDSQSFSVVYKLGFT
jgi:aldose 1-epimerase